MGALSFFIVVLSITGSLAPGSLATDPLLLSIQPSSSDGFVKFQAITDTTKFNLDTTFNDVTLSLGCTNGKTNITFFSRTSGDFFPGGNVEASVQCSSGGNRKMTKAGLNLLGLGPGKMSLPTQLFHTQKGLRQAMAYCISSSATGQLAFGRTNYFLFHDSDVLQARQATLTYAPLFIGGPNSYEVELTGVGVGPVQKLPQATKLTVGIMSRYTGLPEAAYKILRSGVEKAASKKHIMKERTKFDELDLCFKTKSASSFPNVTMEFSGRTSWTVSPSNYLVAKPGTSDVYCFAMKLASASSPPTIGTFQQEDNWVEYNFQNKTLGVSGSQIAQFNLGCGSTDGG